MSDESEVVSTLSARPGGFTVALRLRQLMMRPPPCIGPLRRSIDEKTCLPAHISPPHNNKLVLILTRHTLARAGLANRPLLLLLLSPTSH